MRRSTEAPNAFIGVTSSSCLAWHWESRAVSQRSLSFGQTWMVGHPINHTLEPGASRVRGCRAELQRLGVPGWRIGGLRAIPQATLGLLSAPSAAQLPQ